MSQRPSIKVKKRGTIMGLICALLVVVIIVNLFILQIINNSKYEQLVIDNITTETTVKASRGTIYDCNMNVLAEDETVERIFISPFDIESDEERETICSGLSEILGVDYDEIMKKALKTNRKDETVKNYVEKDLADKVREFIADNGFTEQIHLVETSKRYYPFGTLASHVIGFTGSDGDGLIGIELQYNEYLKGISGKIVTATDAKGNAMPTKYETYSDSQNGFSVVTTLDYRIQSSLEKYVYETYVDSAATQRVAGIVMDVNTGAVLGMAIAPFFDLNSPYTLDEASQAQLDACTDEEQKKELYSTLLNTMWNNKAVSTLYEPGSTFKVITASMALEEDAISDTDVFYCSGTHLVDLGNGYTYPVPCHKTTGHGSVTFRYGLQQSCNPTLMMTAARLGKNLFYKYYNAFGYTAKTGIDLPGEAAGIYHAENAMGPLELAVYSFGQTFKTTPIQQITAISAVANGGNLVTPYIVSKIIDDEGNIVQNYEPKIKRQVISEETASLVTDILEEGVSGDGGAKNCRIKGYKVAGKTGTSQKRDILDESLYVGSAIAYAPADDPQVAVLILVDEPRQNSIYGSIVAAPYVAKTLSETLSYMNIEPVYSQEELDALEQVLPSFVGYSLENAENQLKAFGIKYEIKGGGDSVTDQMPRSGSKVIKSSGKVILYTGDASPEKTISVPNVVGMAPSIAHATLINAGLNINISGAVSSPSATGAVAVKQSIEANTSVEYGTVVEVEFRYISNMSDG
ncbi:MAG: PASTA domain-containing protein [Clostridia bacterium]|nr:PASTA domain-containing protein [Clostridia bacterium]